MKIQDLQFLYEYNYCARDQILQNATKLTPEQFLEPKGYAHGSVRNTLVHILSAEWVWRVRCQEHISPTSMFSVDEFYTLEKIQQRWLKEEEQMRGYLSQSEEPNLDQIVRYKRLNGETEENILWHLLVHVVNHGTEHRSVLAAELTTYGFSPGDIDIVHFTRTIGHK
ncbi:MAG TPA: DinB family protein [Longilinea sp.]|nr:DinB family protein [Longilinea sp.]